MRKVNKKRYKISMCPYNKPTIIKSPPLDRIKIYYIDNERYILGPVYIGYCNHIIFQ